MAIAFERVTPQAQAFWSIWQLMGFGTQPINGRGQQQDRVNLAQNEKTFFVVEFEGGAPDIKSVRILASDNQFSGPVEQSK